MPKRAFNSKTFAPTPRPVRVPTAGGYRTPKVMSPKQFSGNSGRMGFRQTRSLGSLRMTTTKQGISFSVAAGRGDGIRMARTAKGGSRTSVRLPNGYYFRKASR